MNNNEKLIHVKKGLKQIIKYPTKKDGRRTGDGYPEEMIYDEYAYKRIVNSYRMALSKLLKEIK